MGSPDYVLAHQSEPAVRPRLILADGHRMVVDGLHSLLSQEFDVVGTAVTGNELLGLLEEHSADCLLLDIVMPGGNGLELIPTVHRRYPDITILVVSMLRDRVLADACLLAGASGFVPKVCGIQELRAAVGEVLAGRRYLSPRVPKTSHAVGLQARHPALARLTPRQQQIVLLMGEGNSETEIGRRLGLRTSTITFHKKNLKRELGIRDESALRQYTVLIRSCDTQQEIAGTDGNR